ncbi:hypothetical protein [Streptomyces sp. NPDC048611]|uniref:hypothetical protein n=1 Tax=Streptomyces sp. NPDC048611 TaxID=3155635 RepID=UPI003445C672
MNEPAEPVESVFLSAFSAPWETFFSPLSLFPFPSSCAAQRCASFFPPLFDGRAEFPPSQFAVSGPQFALGRAGAGLRFRR